ncbi:uncharacterized protein LOC121723628 isoform X2 [Alosa sapidissima]|uniref:uncharacterized protein LOC121723628 isoform X2 n=1 Tax=Alosa sapidissima TaxID=34773 RepID=UPI001C09914E|nr:uncharacterized protein LOC121723628 isoform X2 [Alosa sapidissima]
MPTSFNSLEQRHSLRMPYLYIIILGYWMTLRRLEAFEMRKVDLGGTMEIECNISFHHDITWLKLNDGQPPIVLMVTSVTDGEITVVYQDKHHVNSMARVKRRIVAMTITNIQINDLGLYYCTRVKDKVLTFGTGVHLYAFGNKMEPPNSSQSYNRSVRSVHCEQGPALPSTGAHLSPFGLVYMVVSGCGLLAMTGAVIVVHLQTKKERVH